MAQAVVSVLALAVLAVLAVNATERERKALEECNKEIKAPPSAIDNLLNMENLDSSKEGKCLVQCGLAAFGVMREDGSIDPENSKKYVMHAYSQPENQARATEIWVECQKKVEKVDDKCEHAYGLISCFVDAAHKENFPKIHKDKE